MSRKPGRLQQAQEKILDQRTGLFELPKRANNYDQAGGTFSKVVKSLASDDSPEQMQHRTCLCEDKHEKRGNIKEAEDMTRSVLNYMEFMEASLETK